MNLMLKLCLTLTTLAVAGLFFIKTPDGQPILSLDKILPQKDQVTGKAQYLLSKAKDKVSSINPTSSNGDANKNDPNASGVYRWQDENGQWQYSNIKPDAQHNKPVESVQNQLTIHENLGKKKNTATEQKYTEKHHDKSPDKNKTDGIKMSPFTVAPAEIPKLIEDTKNVQKLMNERDTNLKKAIN